MTAEVLLFHVIWLCVSGFAEDGSWLTTWYVRTGISGAIVIVLPAGLCSAWKACVVCSPAEPDYFNGFDSY